MSNNRQWLEGDWFAIDFGFERRVFYITHVSPYGVFASTSSRLVSSAVFFPDSRMTSAEWLGRGKRREWWPYVPGRDTVCPFSKPDSLLFG